MIRIRSGDLRHRITIQREATTQDAFGQVNPERTWQDVCRVWSERELVLGKQDNVSAADRESVLVKFRVRKAVISRYGITQAMRIFHDGVYYDIEALTFPANDQHDCVIMTRLGLKNVSP